MRQTGPRPFNSRMGEPSGRLPNAASVSGSSASQSRGREILEGECPLSVFMGQESRPLDAQRLSTRSAGLCHQANTRGLSLVLSRVITNPVSASILEIIEGLDGAKQRQFCQQLFPIVGRVFVAGRDNIRDWLLQALDFAGSERWNAVSVWLLLNDLVYSSPILRVFDSECSDEGLLAREKPWCLALLCDVAQELSDSDWPWLQWEHVRTLGDETLQRLDSDTKAMGLAGARALHGNAIHRHISFVSSKNDLDEWLAESQGCYPLMCLWVERYMEWRHGRVPTDLPESVVEAIDIVETFSGLQKLCREQSETLNSLEQWIGHESPSAQQIYQKLLLTIKSYHLQESDSEASSVGSLSDTSSSHEDYSSESSSKSDDGGDYEQPPASKKLRL